MMSYFFHKYFLHVMTKSHYHILFIHSCNFGKQVFGLWMYECSYYSPWMFQYCKFIPKCLFYFIFWKISVSFIYNSLSFFLHKFELSLLYHSLRSFVFLILFSHYLFCVSLSYYPTHKYTCFAASWINSINSIEIIVTPQFSVFI